VQSFLSLGRLHIPVYGLFAAAGLMCAMALGLRTARLARVDRDALWDTWLVAVISAFVLSRALLVGENLRLFLHQPLLVLELPSLNHPGEFMTAVITLLYLKRRQMPLLNVLDAVAPSVALLWASLSLGTFAEGTREGMPASIPWAIASLFGRVHPVEIYAAIADTLLCGLLLWVLRRARMPGQTGAWGLALGGLILFVLQFFRLPVVLYSTSPLDGDQQRGLEMMVAGGLLLSWLLGVGAQRQLPAKDSGDAV
jgi:phosphatidylglycerol:prolipoprotein diacylglycerol transferase